MIAIEPLEDRTLYSSTLSWNTVAPMPVPRAEGASFMADGKFFCFGGFDNATTLAISNQMDAYDPVTNTWTRMADCPVKVNDNPVTVDPVTDTAWCGGFFLNDGFHASGLMYAYHVKTNTWTQEPSLPTNVGSGQMGVVGRNLYYFGGRNSANVGSTATYRLNLDDANPAWVSDTPMLFTANHDGAVNLNNKIYAIGGIVDKQETTSNQSHVQVFDPSTDQWTLAAPMPIGLGHIASAVTVADGDIIVAGGQENGSGQVMTNMVLQYDPAKDIWTRLTNMPDYRVSGFVGYLDGQLLITGGNQYSSPYINTTTWTAAYSNTSLVLPTVTVANANAQQGNDEAFTVTLSAAATTAVTGQYTLAPGTAPSADYDTIAGSFSIPAGSTQTKIDVPTYGDTTRATERFILTLGQLSANASFVNAAATINATGTITAAPVAPLGSATVLTASAASAPIGSPVVLTAMVANGASVPTGTVSFYQAATLLGSANLDATGAAAFTTTSLPAGIDSISARYTGDGFSAGSVSALLTISIGAPAVSVTTLAAAASTLVAGQDNVFTIQVASTDSSVVPTGSVSLVNDGTVINSYLLDASGSVSVTLPTGTVASTTSFTATYSGDANFTPSTSNAVTQAVLAASPIQSVIGKSTIAATTIAGQPLVAHVPVTISNPGNILKGIFTEKVYADPSGTGLSDHAVLLTTMTRKFNLQTKKSASLPFSIKALPATLAAGSYHLVALVTDPAGQSSIISSSQSIAVTAPSHSIAAAVGPISPAVFRPGQQGTLIVSVQNTGNVTASGPLTVVISTTDNSGFPTGVLIGTLHGRLSVKAGATARLRVHFRAPKATSDASLSPIVTVSLGTLYANTTGSQPIVIHVS